MAKKKKAPVFPTLSSERHYVVYYSEIDESTDTVTKREEKGRHSRHMDAHNYLASIYTNGKMETTGATFEDSTIVQRNPRKEHIIYKWYIEDDRE